MDQTRTDHPKARDEPGETRVAIAIVRSGDRFLVGRRAEGQALAGLAEFPGGKCRPGETAAECAVRECLEETGLLVRVLGLRQEIVHEYPHGRLRLTFLDCITEEQTPAREPFRWITRQELAGLTFPPANAAILASLLSEP